MEYASETGIEIVSELKRMNIPIHSIICIGHKFSRKRSELLKQRTGGKYKRPDFTQLFVDTSIPIYLADHVNNDYCYNLIKSLDIDILVFEGSNIIRKPIYDLPKIGMLNVHAALLPYFRGCSCMEWSILNDFPLGVTSHFIIRAVDAGPIIERIQLKYNAEDSYTDLRAKSIYLVGYAMGQAVNKILKQDFCFEDGYNNKKGKWYSPMKDPNLIAKVENKISLHKYSPKKIKDNLPLTTVDVELLSGKIKVINNKQ